MNGARAHLPDFDDVWGGDDEDDDEPDIREDGEDGGDDKHAILLQPPRLALQE